MDGDGGRGGVDELGIAVRSWAIRDQPEDEDAPRRGGGGARIPRSFLVLDTETTIDAAQRLLFGCWRYYRKRTLADGRVQLAWVAEGLFHPDDLAARDPDGYAVLRRVRAPATRRGDP